MSETPDYVISEPRPSPKDVAVTVETIGSQSSEKLEPYIAEAISSFSNTRKEKNPTIKNKQELLEDIILKHADKHSPPDATDEEKAADRQRFLNAKSTRWRCIFSQWPRDPKGKTITPENSALGKMAPNKAQLWGATLFDFYSVKRFPDLLNLVTFSSGSKLAAWMKANGEDYAKNQLAFAENEEDPQLILPYEISGLVQDSDIMGMGERSWVRDEEDEDEGVGEKRKRKGKERQRERWQVPQPWPPTSPFDPLAYPKPWPIEPFTKKYPKLEKYIMHSHLPTVLKVHDPWNLLRAYGHHSEDKKKKWSDRTDVIRTYRLKTSTKNTTRRTEDDKLAKKEEARRKTVYDTFIADPHSRNEPPSGIVFCQDQDDRQPGPAKPPIFVALPFQPPIPPAREAHLYLSPSGSIGEGNHSFVYSAEFELPRSTFMNDEICRQCIMDEAQRILIEEDGPNGEHRDPKWDEEVGRYIMKRGGKPPLTMTLTLDDEEGDISGTTEYLLEPSTLHISLEYDGPYRLIHSKIGYQCLERGPYCEHIATSLKGIHPLTAKVRVAAKLSIQHDHHLAREAESYQAFPRHFFEHWSGFNIIKPLKQPTPVGPLVPQFYGYYVPDIDPAQSDSDESRSGSPEIRQYLSPILLLENCGKQLDPQKLTLDDQSEAAALVFRFHDAGWIHGSIAKRNIMIQPGPLSDFPLSRHLNSDARGGHGVNWDFRLIDFGRSYEISDRPAREREKLIMTEEWDIQKWIFFEGDLD